MTTTFTKNEIIFTKAIQYWSSKPNGEMNLKTGRKFVALKGGDQALKQQFMQYMLEHGEVTGRFDGKDSLDLIVKFTDQQRMMW